MTVEQARRKARNWLIAASIAIIAKATADAIGVDMLDLPLGLVVIGCCMTSAQRSGWVSGYRDRDKKTEEAP